MKMKSTRLFAEEGAAAGGAGTVVDPAAQQQQQQASDSTATAGTGTVERPTWAPEKFWKEGKLDSEGMAKSYSELERNFSQRQTSGITLPREGASEAEIAQFRKDVGIPDTPDGYNLKPDKLPEGVVWSDDFAKTASGIFHKHNISPAAAKEISEALTAFEVSNNEQARQAYDRHMAEGETALKKEWGDKYTDKLTTVKRLVTSMGFDPSDAELFNNPKVLSFLGKVTGMLSEDSVAGMRGVVDAGGKYLSGAEEARAITMNPNHPDHKKYMEGDSAVIQKVARLYDQG